MSLLAKVFIVIQTVLVMVFLGMSASLYQHRRDWRTSYQKLKVRYNASVSRAQQEIRALRSYVRAKDDVIEAKEREVRSLKTQLDISLQKYQNSDTALQEAKSNNEALQRTQRELNNSLNDLTQRNTQLNQQLDEFRNKYDMARQRREVAEGQVARLTALTTNLETDLSTLRETFADTRKKLRDKEILIAMAERAGVNFERIVSGPPAPAIDGAVVAVKGGGNQGPDLVLLSVGSDDGVERGFHFTIYRDGNYIGNVIVERVLRDSCACRVDFNTDTIRQGDKAATRLY